MTSKEALRRICAECEIEKGKRYVRCPYRSIDNEYCEKYEKIKQDLDRLEKLEEENKELKELFKKHFVYSCKSHTIRKRTTNFNYEIIKGVLGNDK